MLDLIETVALTCACGFDLQYQMAFNSRWFDYEMQSWLADVELLGFNVKEKMTNLFCYTLHMSLQYCIKCSVDLFVLFCKAISLFNYSHLNVD